MRCLPSSSAILNATSNKGERAEPERVKPVKKVKRRPRS